MSEPERAKYLCVTCGTQFAETDGPPARCAICEDERQFVGWDGQQWTTLEEMRGRHRNEVVQQEPGLHSIVTQPPFAIGQRAFLVQTAQGNLLWDCVSLLDDETVRAVNALGGVAAVAVSHPHFYSAMVEWSHAFGGVPVYLHEANRQWVMRPDAVIDYWNDASKELFGGLRLVNTGGHFAGFQVLHWPGGADGKGVLLSGDQPHVCRDRRWVSFMYSYPNLIPLSADAIRRITAALEPLEFERLHAAFAGLTVEADAKAAVRRSAERYVRAIGG
jgi:hypothetical protein